jgi:spore coat protein CotF
MDTVIEILIDNSNSMGPFEADKGDTTYLLPDGSTRMELAKKILIEEIIPKLDYANHITIRRFHSLTYSDNSTKPIIKTIYSGNFDNYELLKSINEIKIPENTGGTPISAAVKLSIDKFAKHPSADRKIILITDGQETDGGDYKKTAEYALKKLGITCNIFIIGISQDKEAEKTSKDLTSNTGGSYVNLKAMRYKKGSLQANLRPIFFRAVNSSLQSVVNMANKNNTATTLNTKTEKDEHATEKIISTDYEILAKNNSSAINLITKQIESITEAIEGLQIKLAKTDTEEEVLITENAVLNEQIRLASESYLNKKLVAKYGNKVKWMNKEKESGSSYDFEVFNIYDKEPEFYIECKASMHSEKVFYLTKNEWMFFLQNTSKYQLFFISNAISSPKLIKVGNLLESILEGRVIPFSNKDEKLKANRTMFTITT